MWESIGFTAIALALDGLVGLSGGLIPERRLARHMPLLLGLAAGAMIAAVFLDILPEALESAPHTVLAWTLVGMVGLALVEWAMSRHPHDQPLEQVRAPPPATLLASDALHNISDGAAVAAAFLVSVRAGIAVSAAVLLHEVPHEVGDFALLRAAGMTRLRALGWLGLAQLTPALGAAAVFAASATFHAIIGPVLGVAAGTFLYIGGTNLLPQIHRGTDPRDRWHRLAGFLLGLGVMVLWAL